MLGFWAGVQEGWGQCLGFPDQLLILSYRLVRGTRIQAHCLCKWRGPIVPLCLLCLFDLDPDFCRALEFTNMCKTEAREAENVCVGELCIAPQQDPGLLGDTDGLLAVVLP